MRRLNEWNENWAFILQPKFVGEKQHYEGNEESERTGMNETSELRRSQNQPYYGGNSVSLLNFR